MRAAARHTPRQARSSAFRPSPSRRLHDLHDLNDFSGVHDLHDLNDFSSFEKTPQKQQNSKNSAPSKNHSFHSFHSFRTGGGWRITPPPAQQLPHAPLSAGRGGVPCLAPLSASLRSAAPPQGEPSVSASIEGRLWYGEARRGLLLIRRRGGL